MPTVALQRDLTVPAVPARAGISAILHDIAEQRGEWSDFALYLNLGSLGLPDVGYVAIPAQFRDLEEQTQPRHEIRFRLRARRMPEFFPTFEGGVGVEAAGASTSQISLFGRYEVPLQQLGAMFDESFARGAAEKTLNNMLTELADAVVARVERREMASARYRLIFNTGD